MKAEGRPRLILPEGRPRPIPFPVANSAMELIAARRNTDCIATGAPSPGRAARAGFATGKGGAEESGGFMKSAG